MPAGEVTVRLNLNKDGYSAGMTAARREAQQLATTVQAVGHTTVSQMQASSAAIRTLEGGMTNSIRAAERFISTIPGVGKALQAAFPVIGGIALAGVFAKIGTEAAKAIETVLKMPQAITNSFRSLNLAGQTANDTLRITNDRLENEIAKLEGKPQNNLKLTIDEARLAADKMAESLDRDNAKIKELLSQNFAPWYAGFMGKSGTSVVSDKVNGQNQHLSDLAAQMNIAQHEGNTGDASSLRVAIDAMRSQYLQDNAKEITDRTANQKLPGALNQGGNLSILQGQQASLYNQFDQESELGRNTTDEAQAAKLRGSKDLAEAQKRAQELLVQQWHQDLDQAKADNDMTVAQEAQFWVRRMETAHTGSLSYKASLDEANRLIAQMRKGNLAGQLGLDAAGAGMSDRFDLSRGDNPEMKEQGRAAVEYLKNLQEQIGAQRQNASAIAEASIQMAVATGQMSKWDAAQAQAALHTQEFQQAMQRLQAALANAAALPAGFARNSAIAGLNAQGTQMAGQRQLQVMQDQQDIAGDSIGPAVRQALDQMVQSFTDLASQLKTIIPKTIDSLNDDMVKMMTGQGSKKDFGKTLMQSGQGLLKTSLQGAEGSILSAFGLGGTKKADGSMGAPFYVKMATNQAGGLLGGIASGLDPGASSTPSGVSGWIGKLLGSFVGGLAGHAGGGDVAANRPSIVGERGPELFMPHTSGSIVPNHALGGSSNTYIDARGSNDPAAIHAAVARALPHAVAASLQAHHQSGRRNPQGR